MGEGLQKLLLDQLGLEHGSGGFQPLKTDTSPIAKKRKTCGDPNDLEIIGNPAVLDWFRIAETADNVFGDARDIIVVTVVR